MYAEWHLTCHAVRMPYIQQVSDADATGDAKRELDLATKRAGRVWRTVLGAPSVPLASAQTPPARFSQLTRR